MMEDKADRFELWLFNLAHGKLTDPEVLQGFIKYYVMRGYVLPRVEEDLVYRTGYDVERAMDQLKTVLEKAAEGRV